MSDHRIREACSCGATIEASGYSPYRRSDDRRSDDRRNPQSAQEVVEEWRANHRHEPPQPEQSDHPIPVDVPQPMQIVTDLRDLDPAEAAHIGFRRSTR